MEYFIFCQKKKAILLFLGIFIWSSVCLASKYYASPQGSETNSGNSPSSPFSLAYATGSTSPLTQGDSLILLDGVYEGTFTFSLNGAPNNPIYILPANEGKAIIDVSKNRTGETAITLRGNHIWLIGIHVTSSTLIRNPDQSNGFSNIPYESGIAVFGDYNKIINCWVYDVVGVGLELWRSGLDLEVYGSVIFNNGSQTESQGRGHGMYIQHDQPNQPKVIENNFVFQNAARGINIYTTNPKNGGVVVRRNISFNTGVTSDFNQLFLRPFHNLVIGSGFNESYEMTVDSNIFYSDLQGGRLNPNLINNVALGRNNPIVRDIKFRQNIIFGGGNMVELKPINSLTFQGNKLFNAHGNFFAFFGTPSSFPNSTWDLNTYRNIANTPNPFRGLSFTDWKSSFSPFDAGSSFSISPSTTREVLITQNKYDPLRFHVSILNFSDSELIELDFSDYEEFKGVEYEIRDIQNPFDPNQKVTGVFGGNSISFPMNWTKSLQPKGNMPHQVVHTDLTFGTFLLVFKKMNQDVADFPDVKDSVTLYLNSEGVVTLTPQNFLSEQPSEPYTYFSSQGFDFDCSDLGKNERLITLKNSRTGEEMTKPIEVWIVDNLPPDFEATDANLPFDLTVGKVTLDLESFYIRQEFIIENCLNPFGVQIKLSKTEITCADFNPDGTYEPISVIITATDNSGNSTSKVRKVNLNLIESKKISITPESGATYTTGQTAEIRLGEEFEFTVVGWYRNGQLLEGEKGKAILAAGSGTYWAKLIPAGGVCEVESQRTEITFNAPPYGEVKESVTLILGPDGKADLNPSQVFVSWPLSDPNLQITLSKTQFSCENTGEQVVGILIKNQSGQTWEESIKLLIKDQTAPILIPKNLTLPLDVTKGVLEITAEQVLQEFGDNCGIKSLTISKNRFTCEDLGKEISIAIRAEDNSGNVTEAVSIVKIERLEASLVEISGQTSFCQGENGVLELSSTSPFEVVRWRRNGTEIPGQTGKTLNVTESGVYHAVIRYQGGCLSESKDIEVKVNALPAGEIAVDGNILRAPEGNFTYQWFRNGEILQGETARTFTAQVMGEYAVELSSAAGCKQRLNSVTLTISWLPGRPVIDAKPLKIYPNPASDWVRLEFPDGTLATEPVISIYSSDGKNLTEMVTITLLNDTEAELQIDRLAKGTYLISATNSEQKSYFAKLIIIN